MGAGAREPMDLPVREFSASGYRSLKQIAYPMSRLDVFVGANGVGKSNLYRGLELLRGAAANTLGRDLAREGLDLAMWAGPKTYKAPAVGWRSALRPPATPAACTATKSRLVSRPKKRRRPLSWNRR
jgi:predicted ATPase